ncbi:unnamed protein product [Gongylonema pulchrum]|uniref:Peptidase C11 n=1 Tax=Gongylonema pulchrum TaxID=637853 RepID=A0A183EAN3_9BILA|nr:unnamed protein product [Gongylonema pulchrum]
MMYDDIAHNPMNPYPGKIFNVPGGENVYADIEIDYSGIHVTPENFLAILTGNKSAVVGGSGRVIESTYHDRIFAYFTDHGGVGILTVKDLNNALKRMHKLKKVGKLVFYMEACEIYAVTAANTHESSWGCYCDNAMQLPCLGDCFSVNWIVDSEKVPSNHIF